MDADSLGGAEALQVAAQHLSTLVFGTAGLYIFLFFYFGAYLSSLDLKRKLQ